MNQEMLKKYAKMIDAYVKPNIFASCSPACGVLKHPYVDPSAQYAGNLWDWDSYWVIKAMILALERYRSDENFDYSGKREKLLLHAKGTIANFFDHQEEDGFIPMMITSSGPFMTFYRDEHRAGKRHNAHKPFLLQNILQICKYEGDYSWVDVNRAVRYLEYYEREQYNAKAGLFFWVDDVMIGIDNNPTVFFRPNNSSADIYLNAFMALEYDALTEILTAVGDSRAAEVSARGEAFKRHLNDVCYDKKDDIYYSHDLLFYGEEDRLVANGFLLHEWMIPAWKSMPMKIRFWGCFLPMYAGFCDKDRAKAMAQKHLTDPAVMANYGVRTVASDEIFYNLEKTSNPSNWLGAIWMVANYCVYKGLKNYDLSLSRDLAERSIRLLGENLEKSGAMYESYLPDTGEPCLYPNFFNWNVLVLEMLNDMEA